VWQGKPSLWVGDLKTIFGENGYSTKQIRRTLNPAVRTSKPKDKPASFAVLMSRRLTAGSTECWPNATSNALACHLGRSPVSVRWRAAWD
jgi:hypothetical protein